MSKCQEIFVFVACLSLGYSKPLKLDSLLISPDTVKYYASFIHSSALISDLTIHFGSGTLNEELLRVPMASWGDLTSKSLIRITIGMNPSRESDPFVGITDGYNFNQFQLGGNSSTSPCKVRDGLDNSGSGSGGHGDPMAREYTLLFDPFHQFGSCSTNNGFSTSGKFSNQLNARKGLSLVVHRCDAVEKYTFHYLLIEFV